MDLIKRMFPVTVVLKMRYESEVWMVGFPCYSQPLERTCSPHWQRIDIQRRIFVCFLFRIQSSLSWRTPSIFWQPKTQRLRRSFRGLSIIQTWHLKVQNIYSRAVWKHNKWRWRRVNSKASYPGFNLVSFLLLFRAADQSPELLREHLKPHQHHQPLKCGKSQGAGGQKEEEEELGEDTLINLNPSCLEHTAGDK